MEALQSLGLIFLRTSVEKGEGDIKEVNLLGHQHLKNTWNRVKLLKMQYIAHSKINLHFDIVNLHYLKAKIIWDNF